MERTDGSQEDLVGSTLYDFLCFTLRQDFISQRLDITKKFDRG